jgi:hypothetical protein
MNKEEKLKRIKEINELINPLYYEKNQLDEDIQYEEFEEFCNKSKEYDWYLESNNLYLDEEYKGKVTNTYLDKLFPHNSFNNKEYSVFLNGADGSVYFSFQNDEIMFNFIEKYELEIINLDEMQSKINQIRDNIEELNRQANKLFNLMTQLTLIKLNKKNKGLKC